jgi:hypothetical protein
VLLFFSEMCERYMPIDPFLLESNCWPDSTDLMKDILEFNTKIIDTVLAKLTEGVDSLVYMLYIKLVVNDDRQTHQSTA